MKNFNTIILFYNTDELSVNDLEKEIIAGSNNIYHLFFFHNKNLHFSKAKILKEVLLKKFEEIIPDTGYNNENNTITLTKKLEFNLFHFDKLIDDEYDKYLSIINYRIDCILQTFSLFVKIYKNRNQIYLFPGELLEKFVKYMNEKKFKYKILKISNNIFKEDKILYLINDTLMENIEDNKKKFFVQKQIIKIFQILN